MNETWKHTAKLRSGVLLISEDQELTLSGQSEDILHIHFACPRLVNITTWLNYDHGTPQTAWDYDVSIDFHATDENEAQTKAWQKLESITARLSFIGSAPVTIESYGSITNAPEPPVKDKQYKTISLSFEQVWEGKASSIIDNKDTEFLRDILVADSIIAEGEERINRSMRWLQHSYFASAPTDEFVSLMLSFEAISHLLKQPKPHYWHCNSCNKDIVVCPECEHSTEWAGSGNLAMRDFVYNKLAWTPKQWKEIWGLRNILLHGSQDLSAIEQQNIFAYLPDLENAVLSALKYLLKLPENTLPKILRQRGMFYGASLHTPWTIPSDKITTVRLNKAESKF